MSRKKRPPLTEREWSLAFEYRCKSKRGEALTPEQRTLTDAAWNEDQARYSAMEGPVFDATVPFGSTVRWRDRKVTE